MIAPTIGKVYLVGAGPGDPELITLKGKRCLEAADVILFDELANHELLEFTDAKAELIYVGKKPGKHCADQREIEALLIRHARLGRTVVRLKGGDPFVFGRGGEEALALHAAGIAFEVVPRNLLGHCRAGLRRYSPDAPRACVELRRCYWASGC
jgi:uroporphyrin-III C-methyltransferase